MPLSETIPWIPKDVFPAPAIGGIYALTQLMWYTNYNREILQENTQEGMVASRFLFSHRNRGLNTTSY